MRVRIIVTFALLLDALLQASAATAQYRLLSAPEKELFDACRPEMEAFRNAQGISQSIDEAAFATSMALSATLETTIQAAQARLSALLTYDPNNHQMACILRARIRQLGGGHSAPTASRPPNAAKAAPQVATNLPTARPERMAPWSPQAMAADPKVQLDPKICRGKGGRVGELRSGP